MSKHASGTKRQPVKIGMLPVLTLVAILGFATLAVLAVTTSHAMGAIAQRQATSTTDAYLLEDAGQRYVAAIDDALETGASLDFATLANTAATQVAIELAPGSSSTRIRSWKLTGVQAEGADETLWDNTQETDSTTTADTANE